MQFRLISVFRNIDGRKMSIDEPKMHQYKKTAKIEVCIMPQFFKNKRLIILLVSIIILVALIGFSLSDREKLTMPEQVMKDTTGFIQHAFSKPANYVAGIFHNLHDLQNTYAENKELKARLDDITRLEIEVQELSAENKKLSEIVDKKEDYRKFEPLQATVIARTPDQWQEQLTIDKGSIHGVEKNMAVISAQGLIGKVKHSQQFTSTIQLLSTTDPKSRISAAVLGSAEEVYGTIEGYDDKKKMLILKSVRSEDKMEEGQDVITSGLGGVFPKGLPIGKVTEVFPDQYGLTQAAYVKPFADFYSMSHVMVVKRDVADEILKEILNAEEE